MSFDILQHISLFTPVAIGVLMGMLSSLFGMGGSVVGVPLLIFAGVPATIAVGTQAPAQMLTGLIALRGHWKAGTADLKMASLMWGAGLLSLLIGNWLYSVLEEYNFMGWVVKGLYIVLMTLIGGSMLVESGLQILRNQGAQQTRSKLIGNVEHWPWQMHFPRLGITTSLIFVFGLGLTAGLLAALMGVGGGFFLVPAMMYLMSLNARQAAGTSLIFTVATSFVMTVIHIAVHHTVDYLLAILLIFGGIFGARFGTILSAYVRGAFFRLLLGFFICGIGLAIAVQAFLL